jgi:hypothetical protein
MDSKNFTIGILSTTAAILLVGLILMQTRPEPAYAANMNDRGGDYLLVTGQVQVNQEMLYVIDAASEKVMSYIFDLNGRRINVVGNTGDLGQLRGGGSGDSGGRSRGRR